MKLRIADDMPVNHWLAKRFDRVGDDFIECHKVEGLDADNLDFDQGYFQKKGNGFVEDCEEDVWACDTECCHGGWGAIMYKKGFNPKVHDFTDGAESIAAELGFSSDYSLSHWAEANRHLWGNNSGDYMFGGQGYIAFGFENPGEMTLADIGKHYKGVAKRIRAQIAK